MRVFLESLVALLATASLLPSVEAFTATSPFTPSAVSRQRTTISTTSSNTYFRRRSDALQANRLLEILPNPFGSASETVISSSSSFDAFSGDSSSPEEQQLVNQAKRLLQSDFGLTDPSLLADNDTFRWIGSNVDTALSKTDYIAAGRFFNLRSAFPDLDYRAHDFRILDEGASVRFTCRVTGTMRGELRLRSGVLPPTGLTMRCPPAAVTMEFDKNDLKLTKLVEGFCMDRLVGNTDGTNGVVAASKIAGEESSSSSNSDFDLLPIPTVLGRLVGRPVKPIPETTTFLAPFPETVMIQLAKGIISSDMASQDPTLLADDFTYCTPIVGPVSKRKFLDQYAAMELEGYDPGLSNFRIDPYDPVRVWVDLNPTSASKGYQGHPQAMSFTFDDDGFCTRLTTSAVMDPTVGNGGGLGGPEGYKYATGQATNPLFTRPLPRLLGRVRKAVLSPITGIGVDEYYSSSGGVVGGVSQTSPPTPPSKPPPPIIKTPAQRLGQASTTTKSPPAKTDNAVEKRLEGLKDFASSIRIRPPVSTPPSPKPKPAAKKPAPPKPVAKKPAPPKPVAKKPAPPKTDNAVEKRLESLKDFASSIRIQPPTTSSSPPKPKPQVASVKKQSTDNKAKQQAAAAKKKAAADKAKQQAAAEQKKFQAGQQKLVAARQQQAEERRVAAQAAAEAKKRQEEERKRAAAAAAETKKREAEEKRAAIAAAAEARKKQAATAAEAKKRQAEEKKREAAAAAEAKKKAAEEKNAAAAEAKKRQAQEQRAETARRQKEEKERKDAMAKAKLAAVKKKASAAKSSPPPPQTEQPSALSGLAEAASRATVNLFGLGKKELEELPEPIAKKSAKKAPFGVPTLSRWRKNGDSTITGLVSGSKAFDDGSRITTSPIVSGKFESGEVVKTGSGSRYFLD